MAFCLCLGGGLNSLSRSSGWSGGFNYASKGLYNQIPPASSKINGNSAAPPDSATKNTTLGNSRRRSEQRQQQNQWYLEEAFRVTTATQAGTGFQRSLGKVLGEEYLQNPGRVDLKHRLL